MTFFLWSDFQTPIDDNNEMGGEVSADRTNNDHAFGLHRTNNDQGMRRQPREAPPWVPEPTPASRTKKWPPG